jgi:hypothetical protein
MLQHAVGVLGSGVAAVDERGMVRSRLVQQVDWVIGAEDHWHDPRREAAVRQVRLDPAPAFETRLRVPSGDAVQRVFAARATSGEAFVVIEVENESPAPFALAIVLHADTFLRRGTSIDLDDDVVLVDGRPRFVLPRAPMRWATGVGDDDVIGVVTSGAASDGPFVPVQARRNLTAHAAFVFPVAHRTALRVALPLDPLRQVPPNVLATLPTIDRVRQGWVSQLGRAMRVELPDPLGSAVDVERAMLLLNRAYPSTVTALEDWGFDDEAMNAWRQLTLPQRQRARGRTFREDAWDALRSEVSDNYSDAKFLRLVRDVLIHDRGEEIDILPGFPPEWLGQPIAVHDAPTRAGKVSFAVRWHGERPALLWEAPENVELRTPALDPTWSARGGSGEALLAAWRRSA